MVIMSNTIHSGTYLDNIDNRSDNSSIGSLSSFNRNEIPAKNDKDMTLRKITTKSTGNNNKATTDDEGWTTTSPGKTKPKNSNSTAASIESIITTIDGNFDQIEAGTHNRIYVTSPGRKNKCNIPDDNRKQIEYDFNPTTMAGGRKEQGNDKAKDNGDEEEERNDQGSNTNESKNIDGTNGKKDEEQKSNAKDNGVNRGNEQGGRGGGRKGRGGRGGRGGRPERNLTPKTEWKTYDFAISFNPKTMANKNPDTEFQSLLSQIMKKSPGVTFHPTNEDMYPKPKSFSTIQDYPQTEAGFKDFFEVYENKGMTTYKIFLKATMHYDELDLRNSMLNYLRTNNLWMESELIHENIDEMVGYINFGHDKMVWRPECEKKINNGIQALIQSGSISEALRLKINGLKKDIKIRVATGTFRGGPSNDPVMCEGLVLRTTKAQARACMELLGSLDDNLLGNFYSIIPKGIDKELGPQYYGELLRTNNDMLNKLRAITVVNWPEELFREQYNPASEISGTVPIRVERLLMDVWKCVAIERTSDTETRGKYLLLFRDEDMEKAKDSIGSLIEAFGRESDRTCAKIALERFQEFPEFDSIQRVSQSVHSKGLRLREMLETAAAQRTTSTPKKAIKQRFQFHVPQELQQQLPLTANQSYSNVAQKKQLTRSQTPQQKPQPTIRQIQPITPKPSTTPTTPAQTTQVSQDARTVATNHSGLSDQQTMTTMMTQITAQFRDMEKDRITREDRNEMKRQERETRMEEKRLETETKMYTFMQTMVTLMATKNNNQDNNQSKEIIPDGVTTNTMEQTSDITTSIITAASTTSAKRPSSQLSNQNEETEMKDNEDGKEEQEENESEIAKRNKTMTATEELDKIVDDEVMNVDEEQPKSTTSIHETTITDEIMTNTDNDTSSFTSGFYNQQFKSKTDTVPFKGVSRQ